MINEQFVIVGAVLNFIGGISYLIDTLKGKVKPNKVTWFLWALAPLIAFAAEIKQGVGIQALMTFTVGFNPLLIFIASFVNKKSQWKLTSLDYICGVLSILGIILWLATDVGDVAILFSICADALAAVPTIIKAYNEPKTESYMPFLGGMLAAGLTLLTITQWNIAHSAFPLYIFIINIFMVVLIMFEPGKHLKNTA
ncbi:MAG: hypothetical protein RI947_1225 [Candidatus Parcubacteria bacterium]|jgi:hypothetical protein